MWQYPESSGHIRALCEKKSHCINDCLHKVTHTVAEYCAKNGITRVIIGDLTGIRKDRDFGHKTDQQLHGWPFAKITRMLRCKLALRGILLIQASEAYTSQCSPLAPSVSKKHATPSKRVSRGLYQDGGCIWNADVVGAYNLLRRWLEKAHPQRRLTADMIRKPPVILKAAV